MLRTLATLIALGCAIALGTVAAAADTVPGDLWEVTSRMAMPGLPGLPANTRKVCSPKVWTEPPGAADERLKCTSSDFKLEDRKATWKVTCAGPPPMTGDGEITRSNNDLWSGSIRFASEEGAAMTVELEGKKLGDCEARP